MRIIVFLLTPTTHFHSRIQRCVWRHCMRIIVHIIVNIYTVFCCRDFSATWSCGCIRCCGCCSQQIFYTCLCVMHNCVIYLQLHINIHWTCTCVLVCSIVYVRDMGSLIGNDWCWIIYINVENNYTYFHLLREIVRLVFSEWTYWWIIRPKMWFVQHYVLIVQSLMIHAPDDIPQGYSKICMSEVGTNDCKWQREDSSKQLQVEYQMWVNILTWSSWNTIFN